MKTAIITVKTNPLVKSRAQKMAKNLGLALSSVVNGFLNQFIKTGRIDFSVYSQEEPTEYMLQALKEAREDVRQGKTVSFRDKAKLSLLEIRRRR